MSYLLSHPSADSDFTAENYGKIWSVDHVTPLAAFNLADIKQQRIAFHHTNCQPMRITENISKGSLFNGTRHRHSVQCNNG